MEDMAQQTQTGSETMIHENTWTRIADSDGGGGLGMTTMAEKEQAQFMDLHYNTKCECGGRLE